MAFKYGGTEASTIDVYLVHAKIRWLSACLDYMMGFLKPMHTCMSRATVDGVYNWLFSSSYDIYDEELYDHLAEKLTFLDQAVW